MVSPELADLGGISFVQLRRACMPATDVGMPMWAQRVANPERVDGDGVGVASYIADMPRWFVVRGPPSLVSLRMFSDALFTFPAAVGGMACTL